MEPRTGDARIAPAAVRRSLSVEATIEQVDLEIIFKRTASMMTGFFRMSCNVCGWREPVQDFEKLTPQFLDLLTTTMLERLKRTVKTE